MLENFFEFLGFLTFLAGVFAAISAGIFFSWWLFFG
jgi:hypothetical protein